jgi:hypothetical protein
VAQNDKQRYLEEKADHKHTKAALEAAQAVIRGFDAETADLRRLRDTGAFAKDASAIFNEAAESTVGRLHGAVTEAMARLEELRLKTLDRMASLVNEELAHLREENAALKSLLADAMNAKDAAEARAKDAVEAIERTNTALTLLEKRIRDGAYRMAKHLGGPSCADLTLQHLVKAGQSAGVNAFAFEAKVWLDEQIKRGVLGATVTAEPVKVEIPPEAPPASPEPPASAFTVEPGP